MGNATELCSNWLDSYFKERPQMKAPPMGVFGYEMPEWTAAVIQKLLSENLGLIEECSEIREKLAAMDSQEPVYFWKEIGETDWMECGKDWYWKCVDRTEHDTKLLYAKPVPDDKPATQTLDSPARVNHTVFGVGVPHSTVVDAAQRYYQHMKEPQPDAETLASAQREMRQLMGMPKAEPAVSVPDGWKMVPIDPDEAMLSAGNSAKIICGHDGMDDPIYTNLGKTEVKDVWRRLLAAAPSHSQQSEGTQK